MKTITGCSPNQHHPPDTIISVVLWITAEHTVRATPLVKILIQKLLFSAHLERLQPCGYSLVPQADRAQNTHTHKRHYNEADRPFDDILYHYDPGANSTSWRRFQRKAPCTCIRKHGHTLSAGTKTVHPPSTPFTTLYLCSVNIHRVASGAVRTCD